MNATSHAGRYSVFGDSISTLYGYQPDAYPVEYKGRNRDRAGVRVMEDTWWGMVINHFGGRLLINDSYSGCMVTRDFGGLFPSACSPERIAALAAGGLPDVLLIELGLNDWDAQRPIRPESARTPWHDAFEPAYAHMLRDLRERFPKARLWCLNLAYSAKMSSEYAPERLARMEDYNAAIAAQAAAVNARVVDLHRNASLYSSWDLAHPDRAGMARLAEAVIRAMEEE